MIIGIDPGLSGAIALLNPYTGGIEIYDMPTLPNPKGKPETDLRELGRILRPFSDKGRNIAVIEKVSAMPGQGVSSMFRFGQNFGAIQMAAAGHGYEIHYVTPTSWKKHFRLSKDKGVSRGLAGDRFPANSHQFTRVKDDGRAEAALLALYGLETILNTHAA